MAELAPGSQFAGHRIEGVAGRGGMGVVYLATHLALNRRVALKVIAPALADSPEFRERFKRESEIAASIDHPHVIPIYHAGEEEHLLFITMRYIEGTDLRGLIEEGLAPGRVPAIVAQVAEALDAAHAHGLVHRDVKPANILVAQRDGRDHVYLTDFGLTKVAASAASITKSGEWVGTLDYVAPEQIEAKPVDARADVYALGAVVYHAFSRRVPYPRDSDVAKMFAHLREEPPSLSGALPWAQHELDEVVRRAMAKDPADRYPSTGDLARALRAAVQGRAPTEPERTVAIGAAAPGSAGETLGGAAAVPGSAGEGLRDAPTRPLPPSVPAAPPPAAPPPRAPAPPPRRPPGPPPRGGGGRTALLLLGIAALLILGAGAVVLATSGDDGGDDGSGSMREQDEPGPPLRRSEVRDLLDTYAGLYTAEDAAGLGDLLTEDAVRRNDGEEQDRNEAIVEYRDQFADLTNPVYTLTDVSIDTAEGEATAEARYSITASELASPSTGSITFHVVEERGRLLIDELDIATD